MLVAGILLLPGTVMAAGSTIYNTMPSPVPGNVVSLGYEATSTAEFGDQLAFGSGPRVVRDVTVLMSSWGCEAGNWYSATCATTPGATFSHPITINLYNVGSGGSVGTPIGSKTQTFNIPFRPSSDSVNCTGGRWYNAADSTCYNGLATPITFTNVNLTVPNNVILTIAYNTSHYGAAPIGNSAACYSSSGGCGYDSLNVGLVDPAATQTVGTNPAPNGAYLSSTWAGAYCDGGTGGTSFLRLDAAFGACNWTGYKPALTVTASYPTATTANACKKDGWMALSRADGSNFKNQGDCIQYVNTGK